MAHYSSDTVVAITADSPSCRFWQTLLSLRRLPLLLVEKPFRMVIVVCPGLTVVEVRRRNPLRLTVSEFDCPPTFIDEHMFGFAGEGQLIDVGPAAPGPVVNVVDFSPVAGYVAAGGRAAAVLGVEHHTLIRRGDALRAAQIQRAALVFVEH